MTTILRQQTQTRLDRQLIGTELLEGVAAGEFEYADVDDWDRFVSHGGRPSELGSVDWLRLTGLRADYRKLHQGIGALHFEHADKALPINASENIAKMSARLVVAMKNKTPLNNLLDDLKHVQPRVFDLPRIPALIIDDESDQASINTKRPGDPATAKKDVVARTKINDLIVQLLDLMPRAQYVGYTATPFASVFVDPNDRLGVFPRDFIIGLDRPADYMGAADYHDFRAPPPGKMSNERSYVRDILGEDLDDANLRRASIAFC